MVKYIIACTATKNPDINGRTLYLTTAGFWSLDRENARKFDKRVAAEGYADFDKEHRVEEVQS